MADLVVLLPVYRNQAGLDRSLESLRRARACFEVCVVDDGSPEPVSVPSPLRGGIAVSLLRLERNVGIAAALNVGLRHILERQHSYIARLDAGDTILEGRFEHQLDYLEREPRCAAVSSFVDFVDASQTLLFSHRPPCNHSGILQSLRLNNCILHPASMIRASALRECGIYREDTPGAEDYELFLRLSRRYQLAVLPEVLTYCEYSPRGLSNSGRRRQQRERLKLQLRYFDPKSPYSFLGIARTLVGMVTPQETVFRFKRVFAG